MYNSSSTSTVPTHTHLMSCLIDAAASYFGGGAGRQQQQMMMQMQQQQWMQMQQQQQGQAGGAVEGGGESVFFEYRGKDGNVHGPYGASQMRGWAQQASIFPILYSSSSALVCICAWVRFSSNFLWEYLETCDAVPQVNVNDSCF